MRAMAAEAEATREAKAKVIAAEGEQKSSRALREAAVVISENPAALQLRYLQTLSGIASEHNSTIVFPLPMEMITSWIGGGSSSTGTTPRSGKLTRTPASRSLDASTLSPIYDS